MQALTWENLDLRWRLRSQVRVFGAELVELMAVETLWMVGGILLG
jgi:hypothetical protein